MTITTSHTAIAVLGALLTFGAFVVAAVVLNGGVFEYPLDDVYIHLAMAEQMAAGGYGVNAGEYASAASSPIYPFFLLPWAGTEAQRWLPLFWNVLALILAAALVGQALARADLGRIGLAFALIAPFALSMHIAAYAGMENMAHGAASLAIVLGLWRFVETDRIGLVLILGVFLAPALRLEGLALAAAAGGAVALLGRPLAGVALIALGALPVVVLVAYLTSLGLDPLPNSVNAKLPDPEGVAGGFIAGISSNIKTNAMTYGGRYLTGLVIAVWLAAMIVLQRGDQRRGLFGLAVAAAGVAHLAFAATGWLDRYENYLIVALFAALALLLGGFRWVTKAGLLGMALLAGIATYGPYIDNNLANMRAIHLQQAEMSRFAKEYVAAPVAVNDLGYVAWANPDYVLDLWGLASAKALEARQTGAPAGWADALADEKGVRVAMIYTSDDWLPDALGADWVRLGSLWTDNANGAFLGGPEVSFFARNSVEANALQADLKDWAAGLPAGARFEFAEGGA